MAAQESAEYACAANIYVVVISNTFIRVCLHYVGFV